LFRFKILAY